MVMVEEKSYVFAGKQGKRACGTISKEDTVSDMTITLLQNTAKKALLIKRYLAVSSLLLGGIFSNALRFSHNLCNKFCSGFFCVILLTADNRKDPALSGLREYNKYPSGE